MEASTHLKKYRTDHKNQVNFNSLQHEAKTIILECQKEFLWGRVPICAEGTSFVSTFLLLFLLSLAASSKLRIAITCITILCVGTNYRQSFAV